MKYQLQIHPIGPESNASPLTIPFESEDPILDIAARVIVALGKKKRGPRKGSKTQPNNP